MLTQEIVRELLDYDSETGRLFWKKRDRKWFKSDKEFKRWHTRYSEKETFVTLTHKGYLNSTILSKSYEAHRIIWLWMFGEFPKEQIDHINHDRADNRLCNLREATCQENSKNISLRKDNVTGHTGVYLEKQTQKWRPWIKVKGKSVHLGSFDSLEDAVSVRKAAEVKYGFHENHGKKE